MPRLLRSTLLLCAIALPVHAQQLLVILNEPIDTSRSAPGQDFYGSVVGPGSFTDGTAIPDGAEAHMKLIDQRNGLVPGPAIRLDYLLFAGQTFTIGGTATAQLVTAKGAPLPARAAAAVYSNHINSNGGIHAPAGTYLLFNAVSRNASTAAPAQTASTAAQPAPVTTPAAQVIPTSLTVTIKTLESTGHTFNFTNYEAEATTTQAAAVDGKSLGPNTRAGIVVERNPATGLETIPRLQSIYVGNRFEPVTSDAGLLLDSSGNPLPPEAQQAAMKKMTKGGVLALPKGTSLSFANVHFEKPLSTAGTQTTGSSPKPCTAYLTTAQAIAKAHTTTDPNVSICGALPTGEQTCMNAQAWLRQETTERQNNTELPVGREQQEQLLVVLNDPVNAGRIGSGEEHVFSGCVVRGGLLTDGTAVPAGAEARIRLVYPPKISSFASPTMQLDSLIVGGQTYAIGGTATGQFVTAKGARLPASEAAVIYTNHLGPNQGFYAPAGTHLLFDNLSPRLPGAPPSMPYSAAQGAADEQYSRTPHSGPPRLVPLNKHDPTGFDILGVKLYMSATEAFIALQQSTHLQKCKQPIVTTTDNIGTHIHQLPKTCIGYSLSPQISVTVPGVGTKNIDSPFISDIFWQSDDDARNDLYFTGIATSYHIDKPEMLVLITKHFSNVKTTADVKAIVDAVVEKYGLYNERADLTGPEESGIPHYTEFYWVSDQCNINLMRAENYGSFTPGTQMDCTPSLTLSGLDPWNLTLAAPDNLAFDYGQEIQKKKNQAMAELNKTRTQAVPKF